MDFPYIANIKKETIGNNNYRKVLHTTKTMQLVVMSLEPGQEIGMETHDDGTQFIRIESGQAKAIVNDVEKILNDDDIIIIEPGAKHNIINTSQTEKLKLYSIYAPSSEHKDLCVQPKKTDQCIQPNIKELYVNNKTAYQKLI
jgi:mannose-6-phosphate isomerase-like protein (cupin superfamily)